ncbi:hypothetical protein MMYC01_202399, partial [Madurella mycetomatis]
SNETLWIWCTRRARSSQHLGMIIRSSCRATRIGDQDDANIANPRTNVIVVTDIGLPLALTCVSHLLFVSTIHDRVCLVLPRDPLHDTDSCPPRQIKPYLVYLGLVGTYQVRSLPFLLGNAPMMLLSVLLLFSSLNNVLLWLYTGPTRPMHRWVARFFILHVVIHTIIGLEIYTRYTTRVRILPHLEHSADSLRCGQVVGRILKSCVCRAKVTNMGKGYIRVDIPMICRGAEPGKHV